MAIQSRILPIILCGGSGTRLWPLSRKSYPKQYLSINPKDKFSFLQKTLNRLKKLENKTAPIIVCNEEHRFITAEQVREINITPKSILLEPCSRNTAPAIAIAALSCISDEDDPILLILPSDHQVKNNLEFLKSIREATKVATKDKIITFGVKPKNPATGYGYIKSNKNLFEGKLNAYQIEKFVEKPNLSLAENLYKNEYFSWNSGIYMAKASIIIREIKKYCPEIILHCKDSLKNKLKDLDFSRIEKISFEKCPNISIDKAVMEKTDLGVVFPLNAEWSDIGGWQSFWENSVKDSNENLMIGDAIQISSKNSLINSYSRLVVALGVEDLIIVETNDAVLVAKKNQSENIKLLINHLKTNNRIEGVESKKDFRPWGNFFSIEEDINWKIKRIEVNPGASLSLQIHKHRAEHWIVVKGKADVEINKKKFKLKENQSCFIPKGEKHRLSNSSKETLIIIEVQSGEYLGEDDIIRFEDNYGRNII